MTWNFGRVGSVCIVVLAALSACGSNDNTGTFDDGDAAISDTDGGEAADSSSGGYDSSLGSDSASAGDSAKAGDSAGGTQCVSHCTSDSDCQNSCPPAPNNGINCCDTASGVCFGSTGTSCTPAGGGDAGP